MSKHGAVRDLAEWVLVWPVLQTLGNLPLPLASLEARLLSRLMQLASPGLVSIAHRNLSLAMPQADGRERDAIVRGVYRSLGRSLLAFARFPRLRRGNIGEWIRYEGLENLEMAQECGKGVLLATAHLGNWELSALAHGLYGHPMNVLVRPLDNPRLDRLVARYRMLSGNRLIEKTESARRIFEALRANQAVGMLIDQNATPDSGVFVDFFGVPACASTGLIKIALRSGAPVVPGFALWEEREQRYVLRFWPPVEMIRSADPDGDVITNTARLHAFLEGVIRQYPDQWLWIHRRWKTRPPGEKPIYEGAS